MAKYCASCGAELDAAALTCPVCGQSVDAQPTQEGGQIVQSAWDSQTPQTGWEPSRPQPTMKWFKFVIWVQLFLAALGDVGTGIAQLTGSIYGDYAPDVYAMFGLLRPLDILSGLLCLALAVAAIYVRFQLSGYKKKGPALYLSFLLAGIAVSLVYLLLTSLVLGGFAGDLSTVASLVTSTVLYFLNRTYFAKRSFLFVN